MSKIRILAIPPDTYGVGKFRITNPYSHLQEHHGDEFHVDIKTNVPDDDKEFEKFQTKSLSQVKKMVEKNGAKVFENLDEISDFLNSNEETEKRKKLAGL